MEENSEMKTKLKDLRMCDTPPRYFKSANKLNSKSHFVDLVLIRYYVICVPLRSLSEGAISKPCASFDGLKGLEEMRAQYIKAVGKIKSKC